MNLLFVCTMGRDRSYTAARWYHGLNGIDARYGGAHPHAHVPITREAMEWADRIITFEPHHQASLTQRFGGLPHVPMVCLEIRNWYQRDSPLLRTRIAQEMARVCPDLPAFDWIQRG